MLGRTPNAACACLVVDFHLADCDGLTLIQSLRDRQRGLPVSLITTHPGPDDERRVAAMAWC